MKEISTDAVIRAAEQAAAQGRGWHFHILSPTCCFNPIRDRYGLVVEISATAPHSSVETQPDQLQAEKIILVAYTRERPVEEGRQLVALLHGERILEGTGSPDCVRNETTATILVRARELNARGIAWHHHMLFPDCALNPNPGSWNLLFEDPETGQQISALYHDEPVQDLREVEALFYAQKK